MIESIMYFGGGFLVACLLAIILISFVHQRAVRLTQRRLEDAIPVSMAEIQADKDHLRAEFALNARRLEMSVEQLKAKTTAQLSDLARKNEAINLLKAELLEKTAVTDELAARVKALGGKITSTEQENLEKVTALEATAGTLAAKDAEIAQAANIIAALNHAADTQRVEIAVLKTQVEDLKSQVGDMQHATDATTERLLSEQSTTADVHKDLSQARHTIAMLHPQVARLEHELAARADLIQDRDARIAEQNRMLHRLEAEAQELRHQLAAARNEVAAAGERLSAAQSAAETQLRSANDVLSERANQMRDLERRASDSERLASQRDAMAQLLDRNLATLKDEAAAAGTRWTEEKRALETELAARDQTLAERAGRIADFERQVADFERLLAQRDADANSLRQEITVLRDEATASAASWRGHKSSLDGQIATAQSALTEHAGRIQAFAQQTADLERLVGQRDREAEALRGEIATLRQDGAAAAQHWQAEKARLEAEIAALTSAAAERTFRIESLEHQIASAAAPSKEAMDGVDELASTKHELGVLRERAAATEQQLRDANAALAGELKSARAELAALSREAEVSRKAEQGENALLREQISDIAAQIAQLTAAPEKADEPAAPLVEAANGNGEAQSRRGSLIERIRALQSRASRISPAP